MLVHQIHFWLLWFHGDLDSLKIWKPLGDRYFLLSCGGLYFLSELWSGWHNSLVITVISSSPGWLVLACQCCLDCSLTGWDQTLIQIKWFWAPGGELWRLEHVVTDVQWFTIDSRNGNNGPRVKSTARTMSLEVIYNCQSYRLQPSSYRQLLTNAL